MVGSRDASTVDAINAAFVDKLEGYVFCGGRIVLEDEVVSAGSKTAGTSTIDCGIRDEAVVENDACDNFGLRVPLTGVDNGGTPS